MKNTTQKIETLNYELKNGNKININNLLECILESAITSKSSDIHISPTKNKLHIKFRIDGILTDSFNLPPETHAELVYKIKILAKLRTDEHVLPQDGRIKYKNNNDELDLRISIVPTYYGENIVIRILSDNTEIFNLKDLGFSKENIQKINHVISKRKGMILVTGPTGSGKTTTLYSIIKILNSPDLSLVTLEDPIEYAIDGVKQIQVSEKHGLNFSNGLRSILRQDPDILMIGEIRDKETAKISVNTSLTGHLLLSTLHTNDAISSIVRLTDMGIEEYLISSTLNLVINQRLVRKICDNCKQKIKIEKNISNIINSICNINNINPPLSYFKGNGCLKCNQSGFNGRISINEVLIIDEKIKELIYQKSTLKNIKNESIKNGFLPIIDDAISKINSGQITADEALKIIYE